MKAKLLSIAAVLCTIVLFITACEKEATGPKIKLSLKDVNGTTFPFQSDIVFRFDYTRAKPADDTNDTLFVVRRFFTCPFVPVPDTLPFILPNATGAIGVPELRYNYSYTNNLGTFFSGCASSSGVVRTDSLNFVFWIKDSKGNVSDTVISPKIRLIRP